MISRLKSELVALALAVQFLTRLPVRVTSAFSTERLAASVRHYPLVGMFVGSIAALAYASAQMLFPPVLAVLISTALVLLVTGAFHEDGLADTFDGIGGGVTREQSLAIMKDSRVGVYGALVLIVALAIKIATLSVLLPIVAIVSLVAAHGLSRWSSIVVIATSNYVREQGTGKPTAEGISRPGLIYASAVGLTCLALVYFVLTPAAALGGSVGLASGHLLMRLFFERKIGGYTGDCLGATQQASEIGMYLGILACQ